MDIAKMWVVCSYVACVYYGVRFHPLERSDYPSSVVGCIGHLRWSNTHGPIGF